MMTTHCGNWFNPLKPEMTMVCIEDIAHHLAIINRFNGATREPYSVAQHCVLMARRALPLLALAALMHDAAEAYVGDVNGNLKKWLEFSTLTSFTNVEEALLEKIFEHFVIPWPGEDDWKCIHELDQQAFVTEARDLINGPVPTRAMMWPERIEPWPWRTAELQFLSTYHDLRG